MEQDVVSAMSEKKNHRLPFFMESILGVKIGTLSKGFSKIDAELSYGNFSVGLEEGAAFKFSGEAKYVSVNISAGDKLSKTKENNYVKIWGTVGSNPKSSIHVITKYGNSSFE